MNFLDMRTVIFSHVATNLVCTTVIAVLWLQNRKRFTGIAWWVMDFALQATATILMILRGSIPDWISMVLTNTLAMLGALCGYVGLERFIGKVSSQIHNYALLVIFAGVHTYFSVSQPNLAARNVNVSLGLLLLSFQCAWLMLKRAPSDLRPLTRGVGLVFGGYCLVNLVRIVIILGGTPPNDDFFKSGAFETLVLLAYQILFVLLTYTLTLTVNGRLIMEVRLQEEKFTKAFHSAPYAITLTRLTDGRIFEVNDGFVELSGYQAAEVIGKTTPELYLWAHDADRQQVVQALAQQQSIHGREYRFRKKSGALFTGVFSAEMLTINNQPCALASINDISEYKRAQEALRESEERFRTMADFTYDWEYWVSPDHRYVYISPACERITGYHVEEFRNDPNLLINITDLRDREMLNNHISYEFQTTEITTFDFRITTRQGEIRWINHFCQAVYNADGRWLGRRATNRDITASKQAEEALRTSEKRFMTIFHANPAAIAITRLSDNQLVDVNQAWQNLTGYTHAEAVGHTPLELDLWVNSAQRAQLVETLRAQGAARAETQIRQKSGAIVEMLMSAEDIELAGEHYLLTMAQDITARKQAEKALRKSEMRYKSLVETQSDVIARSDPNGCLTFVNDAYCQVFGKSRDELLGRVFTPTVFPEDLPIVRKMLTAIQSPPYRMSTETRHPTVSGIRWFSWENAAILDESGNIVELQGIGRDITERKQAEEESTSARAFLEMVIEMSPFAMWISDQNGTIIRVNRALCEAIQLTQDEIVGKYNVFKDINLEKHGVMPQVQAVFEQHTPARFSIPWQAADAGNIALQGASDLYIDISMFPILNARGELTTVVCQWIDISERKRAEEALATERTLLRSIIDLLPALVYAKDTACRKILSNRIDIEYMGASTEAEVIGKTDFDFYPKDVAAQFYALDQAVIQTGQPVLNHEEILVRADGQPHWLLTSKVPLRESSGQIIGLVGVGQDITERKQAEDRIKGQLAELQRWYALTLDRETRVLELKREINALLRRLNEPIRYPSAEE